MAGQTRPSVCLDIAIDHRLLPLFKPLGTPNNSTPSNHVILIREMAETLRRGGERIPVDEIATAAHLAGPATTGGICFILQQPADNHPYHLGTNSVIESSPTLRALLLELWPTVSCDSRRPTIIDRLPFVPPKSSITPTLKSDIQERTFAIIRAKRPDVVVCMWRRKWSSNTLENDDPGSMRTLEGIGIGNVFTSASEMALGYEIQHVNAFHPSFAVNYNPHLSCLRQLLTLELAQACGLYRGQWNDKSWMGDLRTHCKNKIQQIPRSGMVTLSLFATEYEKNLKSIETFVKSFIAATRKCSVQTQYHCLIDSRITEHLNDASLCIRTIHLERDANRPEDLDNSDLEAIDDAARYTISFLKQLVRTLQPGPTLVCNYLKGASGLYERNTISGYLEKLGGKYDCGNKQMISLLSKFVENLNSSFTVAGWSGSKQLYNYQLYRWSEIFLSLAVDMEALLGSLASTFHENSTPAGEQDIVDDFDRLSL